MIARTGWEKETDMKGGAILCELWRRVDRFFAVLSPLRDVGCALPEL